jgi:hypothetical protein
MAAYLDKMSFQRRPVRGEILLQSSDSSNVFFSEDVVYDDYNNQQGEFSSFMDIIPEIQQGVMAGKQGFEQVEISGATTLIHGIFFANVLEDEDDALTEFEVYINLELEMP